jgi:hypothetical protein
LHSYHVDEIQYIVGGVIATCIKKIKTVKGIYCSSQLFSDKYNCIREYIESNVHIKFLRVLSGPLWEVLVETVLTVKMLANFKIAVFFFMEYIGN